jgi:hypothetical protein
MWMNAATSQVANSKKETELSTRKSSAGHTCCEIGKNSKQYRPNFARMDTIADWEFVGRMADVAGKANMKAARHLDDRAGYEATKALWRSIRLARASPWRVACSAGSVCLYSLLAAAKYISTMVMLQPGLAAAQ